MLTNRLGMAIARFRRPALAPAGPDFSTAQIGDEIGGGIYGGTHSNGTETWHLIFAKQSGEQSGYQWAYPYDPTGATDHDDGLANQQNMLANHDDGSLEAFYYCRDYVDADGNDDYYLPALNEIKKAGQLVDSGHSDFSSGIGSGRWSSTEYSSDDSRAHYYTFGGSSGINTKRTSYYYTRPVRRVAV